jgi:hypothetical protein
VRARVVATTLVVSALALSACGSTLSGAAATASWAKDANFVANTATLMGDARHAASALVSPASSPNALHTVCGVLQTDDEAAYNSLPTPDATATGLLNRAYNALGAGASHCYDAGSDATARARALAEVTRGLADLAEGSARVARASTP